MLVYDSMISSLGPMVLLFAGITAIYSLCYTCRILTVLLPLRLGSDQIGESASSSLSMDSVIIVSAVVPSLVVVLLVSGAAVYWVVKRIRQKSKSADSITSSTHQ